MKIYGDTNSGNCLKVKWVCDHLAIPYRWIDVDTMQGGSRTPEFLQINPWGQVPTVVFDDGRALAQSNAIIRYLARGSELLPQDAFAAAQMDAWLFWEQYSHEPYVATPRYIVKHLPPGHARYAELPERLAKGRAALAVMETHLSTRTFFVAERYTIADIALYAYTHVAHEGGHDLSPYPSVRAWLARVAAQPRYVELTASPKAARG